MIIVISLIINVFNLINYFFLFDNLILLDKDIYIYIYISNFIFKFERIVDNVKLDKN